LFHRRLEHPAQHGLAARNVTDVRHDGLHRPTCYHADVVGDDLAFVFVEFSILIDRFNSIAAELGRHGD